MFIAFRIEREWCEITAFDDWKMIQYLMKVFFLCVCVFFSPTAECYGVFAQYRFRCVLGELGRFWEGTGFWEPVPGNRVPDPRDCQGCGLRRLRARGFEGFDGFDGLGSIPEVWTEPVLEPGVREPEVLRRFRVPEIPIPRFRKWLCTLKVYFCTLKV